MIIYNITLFSAKNGQLFFKGKSEDFWKEYNKKNQGIPLNETLRNAISNEKYLLGEGFSKKGYSIPNIDNYIVRIHKDKFQYTDLEKEFCKPSRKYLDTVDGVVLGIPEKIDIVIKKTGQKLGVDNYGLRICPPLSNIRVSRDETVTLLNIYEKLKDFPLESFSNAYKQMAQFNRKKGYQFDILNPNNIFIDIKKKKISFIDPMDPVINKCNEKTINFAKLHGRNSIYPVLCDFIMQNEHLNNLTKEEQNRWENAIKAIITKCIVAGKMQGYEKSDKNMELLYTRIDKLWDCTMAERYQDFQNRYADVIDTAEIVADALNHKNTAPIRIESIKKLPTDNFKELKPIFERLIVAPHEPKVEIVEILNTILDKVSEYGKEAKTIVPTLEVLFNKEIFFPTKKRLFNLFLTLDPENTRFLEEMYKTANNKIEKVLYINQIKKLKELSGRMGAEKQEVVNEIYFTAISGEQIPSHIVNKLWLSRTCTNTSDAQQLSIDKMLDAYRYMYSLKGKIPDTNDLIEFHKISMKNTPGQEKIVGLIRDGKNDYLFNQIFKIKKIPKNAINPYADSPNVSMELEKLNKYISDNYNKKNPFELAADIFKKLTWIHPFYNGNGRTTRLFVEEFLASKGYKLNQWPEEVLYSKLPNIKEISDGLKKHSVKLSE